MMTIRQGTAVYTENHHNTLYIIDDYSMLAHAQTRDDLHLNMIRGFVTVHTDVDIILFLISLQWRVLQITEQDCFMYLQYLPSVQVVN